MSFGIQTEQSCSGKIKDDIFTAEDSYGLSNKAGIDSRTKTPMKTWLSEYAYTLK